MIAVSLLLSALASIGLAVVYASGGDTQLEGALLGVSLGGIALGLVLVAKEMLPHGPFTEEREMLPGGGVELDAPDIPVEGDEQLVARRGFIAKLFGVAFGALGLAAVFPIRSLGDAPARELFHTPWINGRRMVNREGHPIRPEELAINGVVTVFPEGFTHAADAQTLLIRLPDDVPVPNPSAAAGSIVAFSKICTHAGCPVGLYQASSQALFCPCHQSVFDVKAAAKPIEGPATRPLPQLPIAVSAEGYLVATSDFPEPVGPGFWNRGRA